jgi:hypothetical protein
MEFIVKRRIDGRLGSGLASSGGFRIAASALGRRRNDFLGLQPFRSAYNGEFDGLAFFEGSVASDLIAL